MATYQGSPFEAGVGPTDGDLVLFAACPPPEELGFEPATGHWRKQVRLQDVQAVWESRPVGMFRGERCMVLDDLGDRLHIGFLGHDEYQAEQLGYWQVDRGVFELVAPRTQVTGIVEDRVSYPPRPVTPGRGATTGGRDRGRQPDSPAHNEVPRHDTGQYSFVPPFDQPADAQLGRSLAPQGYLPVLDEISGVALAEPTQEPLPLEAEALRAASASRRAAPERAGQPPADTATRPADGADPGIETGPEQTQQGPGRQRLASEELFADLVSMAGIASDSYAFGEEVDGAFCLLQAGDGFEVFHAAGGSRHELQVFSTEEAACFYLFGVLAADAVRGGSLLPTAARPV
jgi:hypothetical protein